MSWELHSRIARVEVFDTIARKSQNCLDSTNFRAYTANMKFGLQMIMQAMLKRLALVLIAILLLSVVTVALHSHVDGDAHDNCTLCAASHLSFSAPSNNSPEVHVTTVMRAFFLEGSVVLPNAVPVSIDSRAPPV